jgi:small-conductance mechanosensitive channel
MTTSPVSPAQAGFVVDAIQRSLDNTVEQYLATVALGLSFLVAVWIIFLGGPALKRRYSGEAVDIARTLTIMVVALVSALVFVVIWEVEEPVQDALYELLPQNPGETALVGFIAFLVILGTYALSRITKRIVRHWSERGRISPHQRELAHHAIQIALFFVAVAFIIALFNQNPRDLFLGAGVLGVVLGFAARRTLADVLAGFVILFGRPFEAGDWIAVGEREGIVTDITAFNTQIRTFNEEHVLVPNDAVMDREVTNYSKTDRLRLVTEVGVDYDTDVAEAAIIAKETMESCDGVAGSPGPDVILDSFADSAVVLLLRYWIDEPTIQRKLSAQNEVINEVKATFESEGIKIPFPQRELLGREETDGFRVASEDGVTVGDEVERAFRRVRTDSTAVEEPVEDRYRDDDEPVTPSAEAGSGSGDGEGADGGASEEGEGDDVDADAGEDDDDAGVDDGVGEEQADDAEEDDRSRAVEPTSELVEEAHEVSARPRERFEDVDDGDEQGNVVEPVEEEYRDDSEVEGRPEAARGEDHADPADNTDGDGDGDAKGDGESDG